MPVRPRSALLAAGLLAAALLPLAATPAVADSGPVPLGISTLGRVVVDEAHGRLYVSDGPSGAGVRVLTLEGAPVATVQVGGAVGMALTPDGSSLWIAVPQMGLAKLDTASGIVADRVPLPTGVCAGDVAVVGSRLVYGYSCNQYLPSSGGPYGGIGVVDAAAPHASHGTVTTGPTYRPVVAPGPAGQVYAADSLQSPTGLSLFDVSGPAPVLIAGRAAVCGNLRDLASTPSGDQVVTACGDTYVQTAYNASDKLTTTGTTYNSGAYPNAGAWSADGSVYVAGSDSAYEPDVYVFPRGGGTALRAVDFGTTSATLVPRGLAVSRDGRRVWAVSTSATGGLDLRVLDLPVAGASTVTVSTSPGALYVGATVTVRGKVQDAAGAAVAGARLQVTRAATGAAPSALADVTTASDGSFSLTDLPPSPGTWAYEVLRPSDNARASATVVAYDPGTKLTLTLTPAATSVSGYVQLGYAMYESSAGRPVTVSRTATGASASVTVTTLLTDPNGGVRFTDTPPTGSWTYTASTPAYGPHPAATASAPYATHAPTSLTASAAPALAGEAVRLTGTLTAAPAGATVVVSRVSGTQAVWSGTATTAADGTWALSDPSAPVGTAAYTASYAGSTGYASARATASTTVSLRPSAVTLSVARGTGSTKKYAYLTASLTGGHVNRSVTITAQPAGGAEVQLFSGAVDASSQAYATYTPRTTTTYRVSYAGDDWYAASSSAVAQ